ncbi:hypothetical protein HGRIS_010058 [Hohenbuehelia grisea]|uniref:Uncharacterized protein n=1 Tax=Hohenbuehelia grisea TaxID=104357 RepID=A0ABR3J4K3_9AGAR
MLFILGCIALSAEVVHAEDPFAGRLLVGLSPNPNFTLRTYKPVEGHAGVARRHSTLDGLLQRRQQASACLPGYGLCPNLPGKCCPAGGQCCNTGACCATGKICYATGCCNRGETGCGGKNCCVAGGDCCSDGGCCDAGHYCVNINGKAGCCVKGQTCGSGGGPCADRGFIKCSNENYSCAPGQTCYRDASNNVKCGVPQKPPAQDPPPKDPPVQDPPPQKPPVQDPPPQKPPAQDPPPDTPSPRQNPTPSTTITMTRTTTPGAPQVTTAPPTTTRTPSTTSSLNVPTATPPPTQGFVNQIVNSSDARITYFGDGWTQSTSSCFSNIRSQKASGVSHSLQFAFSGTGVYMNVAKNANAGIFGVTLLNNQNTAVDTTVEVDAFASNSESSCGIGWQRLGLQLSQYTLVVDVLGKSRQASELSAGTFELLNFL